MNLAAHRHEAKRAGAARLLELCASLDLAQHPRRPARERLQEALGEELTHQLLRTLSGNGSARAAAA